jgi:hypothetical protein
LFPIKPLLFSEVSIDISSGRRLNLSKTQQHSLFEYPLFFFVAGWEASYAAANRTDILTVDDREAMAVGLCHVLASLPESQRAKSLLALAMPALDCLEAMLRHANEEAALIAQHNGSNQRLDAVLDRLASEIVMVATITTSFSNALQAGEQRDSAAATTTMSNRATVREPALTILKRTWPSISTVATQFNNRVVRSLFDVNVMQLTVLVFFLTICCYAIKTVRLGGTTSIFDTLFASW